jgi:hypothetical protein
MIEDGHLTVVILAHASCLITNQKRAGLGEVVT